VAEVKDIVLKPNSISDLENVENRQIIDADPTSTITTTTIQREESINRKEGECVFLSKMWVKGTPLHLIIDNDS
jgi:hypothetical protein